nr:hypothetical protein [uncultured Roseibium sp.]
MIERYFETGFTYTWNPPKPIERDPWDGDIVRSGTDHAPALTYTGYHPSLYNGAARPSALGIVIGATIRHRWLNYVVGRTAYVRSTNTDVLTGFMSGCWICSWIGTSGNRRVGHIGTSSVAAGNMPPNTTVKEAFIADDAMRRGSHIRGYSPAAAWNATEVAQVQRQTSMVTASHILSLVTTRDEFYSILMMQTTTAGKWICGGKKQVHGKDRGRIQAALS